SAAAEAAAGEAAATQAPAAHAATEAAKVLSAAEAAKAAGAGGAGPIGRGPTLDGVDGLLNEQRIDTPDRHDLDGLGRVRGCLFQLLNQLAHVFKQFLVTGQDEAIGAIVHANGEADAPRLAIGADVAIDELSACAKATSKPTGKCTAAGLAGHWVIVGQLAV